MIKICSDEGRDDCQQLKPKWTEASFGTTVITAAILFIISLLFSRVTVNVVVFALRVVFFHLIVYIVTRYMYDAQIFPLTLPFLNTTRRSIAPSLLKLTKSRLCLDKKEEST